MVVAEQKAHAESRIDRGSEFSDRSMVDGESRERAEGLGQLQCAAPVAMDGSETLLGYSMRSLGELLNIKFALASFVVNNLRRRYRRSVLGFAWSLLNPMLTMTVMTIVFSLLLHRDPRQFGIFIFTGLLPWSFITDSVTIGAQSIVNAEAFLKKVYVPKLFFPLVAVATEGVNFVLSMASLIMLGICLSMPMYCTLLLVPLAAALLLTFNFAVAVFLAIATVYFRDMTHIIRVVLSLAFYMVPIVYPLEALPAEYRSFFHWNPIYYFLNLFRALIHEGRCPQAHEWLIPAVLTMAVFALAMLTLRKTEKDLIYRL